MSKWTRVAGVVAVSLVLCGLLCSSAMAFNIIQVTGQVWYDTNSNGVIDAGEAGINAVTVELWNGATLVGTKTTAPLDAAYESGTPTQDGWYVFTGLTANTTYTVVVTDDAGALAGYTETYDISTPTDDDTATVPVVTTSVQRVDFGYVAPAAAATYGLSGTVWSDANKSTAIDTGETGFNGVTVTLYAGSSATGTPLALDGLVNPVQTANAGAIDTGNLLSDGYYEFDNLPAGTYTVAVTAGTGTVLANYTATTSSPQTVTLTADTGNIGQINFGYVAPCAPAGKVSISGLVINDNNANGTIDRGESGLSGPTVTLYDAYSHVIGTQTAAANGSYAFTGLTAGIYKVVETNLATYKSTSAIAGTGGAVVDKDTILVGATTAGNSYPNQDFLDAGSKPAITLLKTGPATAKAGDKITYHFKVTNSGATALSNVTVNDPMLGGKIWYQWSLGVGQTVEFDKTCVIPANYCVGYGSNCGGYGDNYGGYGGNCGGWGMRSECSSYNPPTCPTPTPKTATRVLVNTATASGTPSGSCTAVTSTSSCSTTVTGASTNTYCGGSYGGYGNYNYGGGCGSYSCGRNYGCMNN